MMKFLNFRDLFQGFREYRPLLKNTSILRLLAAGFISDLGSSITYFALLRKVYDISGGRVTDLGFLTIAQALPKIIFSPLAGILADKLPRKQIMIISDILDGCIILSLIWVHDLRLIYLIGFLQSSVNAFRLPASNAMEPNLVEKGQIILLNSFKGSIRNLMQIFNLALGGMAAGLLHATGAFTIDSLTFFTSALIISTLSIHEHHVQEHADQRSLQENLKANWRDFTDGISLIWEKVNVRMVVLIGIFLNFAMSMQAVLIYYFLKQTLNLGDQAEETWGFLLSVLGVGGIIGSIIIGAAVRKNSQRFKLFLNILLFDAVFFTLFLLNRHMPLSYFLFTGLGAIGAASNIISNSIIQEEIADTHRGRVFSLMAMVNGPITLLSVFIGTVGAAFISALNVLLLSAGFEGVIAIGLRFTKTYKAVNLPRGATAGVEPKESDV